MFQNIIVGWLQCNFILGDHIFDREISGFMTVKEIYIQCMKNDPSSTEEIDI